MDILRAYANEGDSEILCPFVLRVGVIPNSLGYEEAVAATPNVKETFTRASFEPPVVAFVESMVSRTAGSKMLPFSPLRDAIPELRKPFTSLIGLAIAPSKYPYYEGTASLCYRLPGDGNRIAVLTCAHVARLPNVYPSTGLTDGHHREGIVALGTMAFNNAVEAILSAIDNRRQSIDSWKRLLKKNEGVKEESTDLLDRREELQHSIRIAERQIEEANKLHDHVTKNLTTIEQRSIGRVIYSELIFGSNRMDIKMTGLSLS